MSNAPPPSPPSPPPPPLPPPPLPLAAPQQVVVAANERVEKFTGNNFFTWAARIHLIVSAKRAWGIVDGTEPRPADQALQVDWDNRNQQAITVIGLGLSDEFLPLLDFTQTAAQIWTSLRTIFAAQAATSSMLLHQQFMSLRMESNETVALYVGRIRGLMVELAGAGSPVTDDRARALLLATVTPPLSTLASVLSHMAMDFNQVVGALIEEERKMKSKKEAMPSAKSTLLYAGSPGASSSQESGFRGMCHYCHKPGHRARDCKKKKADRAKKENKDKGARPPRKMLMARVAAFAGEVPAGPELWLDTGASFHMTPLASLFFSYEEITYADGVAGDSFVHDVLGKGVIRVVLESGETREIHGVHYVPGITHTLLSVGCAAVYGGMES